MYEDDEKELLERFGATVRKQRLELRLSQEELSERADLNRVYIAEIEKGRRNISLLNIIRLADALEMHYDALLHGLSFREK